MVKSMVWIDAFTWRISDNAVPWSGSKSPHHDRCSRWRAQPHGRGFDGRSSDDRRFASRPSICKASHAGRRSVLEQRTPHSAWKVSLLRAPITGATVMAKRGYAQLENAITRPSRRAFLFLTFIKSPRRCGMNCSTAAQSKDRGDMKLAAPGKTVPTIRSRRP